MEWMLTVSGTPSATLRCSLALPTTDLPGRMRSCLMVDEEVLAKSAKALGKHKIKGRTPDPAQVWVKVVEDNFPDGRFREQPFVTSAPGAEDTFAHYRGSTMIAVSALVEVFDGLRQGKYLAEYHRRGQVYIGEGNWRDL
ncbi:hypothetical protein N7468_007571 [Penicillium chermesinum]|uniref:Uncharacterized protein n=1 Tax=Penicillium chermesinum TaxID=63820 RepID=A0A9W9NV23_9EURO|nr:uncharacterized protein N7468_007571 [Penicillium chermesinum]KAJ5226346.1 hypothetical protein N7468_007571 [Penicillium chermesinum]